MVRAEKSILVGTGGGLDTGSTTNHYYSGSGGSRISHRDGAPTSWGRGVGCCMATFRKQLSIYCRRGHQPHKGAPTPDVAMFKKLYVKNWDP